MIRARWRRLLKALAWGAGPDRVSRQGLAAALARLRQERLGIYGSDVKYLEADEDSRRPTYTRPVDGRR